MPIIFKAPMQLSVVADLILSITDAYYRNDKQVNAHETSLTYWTQEDINADNSTIDKLPSVDGSYIKTNYQALISNGNLDLLRARASDFCIAVNTQVSLWIDGFWGKKASNWHWHLKTRIVNKTLIQDIINGQVVPAAVNEFIISTWNDGCGDGWLESFCAIRNSRIREAQQRIQQNTALSAHQLMRGLLD